MNRPTARDHGPVRLVAVHRNLHAAAAGGDRHIETVVTQARQKQFERIDIVQRGGLPDIAPVQQDVNADPLDAFGLGPHQHGLQVVDVRMDIAIREQAQEVERPTALRRADHVRPGLSVPEAAAVDRFGHQLGALSKHAAGAEGVVADLAVSHILVAGHADGRTVGAQRGRRIRCHQPVQRRRASGLDGIAVLTRRNAHAVEDHGDERAGAGAETG
jgi:hypothetical protein